MTTATTTGETSPTSTNSPGGFPPSDETSTTSTFSTGGNTPDEDGLPGAIYPAGGFLERYMTFGRGQLESADSYILGAFLPVVARCLGRNVWFPWGQGRIFPNCFNILCGAPGDRKSSAISLVESLAQAELPEVGRVLEPNALLVGGLSAESLFDEYDVDAGGCPDKLLVEEEGNVFLGNITKSQYGERVGNLLLRLYDCKSLSENFRRNKRSGNEENPNGRRFVAETSTSILLGATFNVAAFRDAEIRAGLQRRFLYYLADAHGRFHPMPPAPNLDEFERIAGRLIHIKEHVRGAFSLAKDGAVDVWHDIQATNRRKLDDAGNEAEAGRLNGEPMHVLKIAMLFAACDDGVNTKHLVLTAPTLEVAAAHVAGCHRAAAELERVGNREANKEDAQVLLDRIRADYAGNVDGDGWIVLRRAELTARYAAHPGRAGSLTSRRLYHHLIPALCRSRAAKLMSKTGKAEVWGFRDDA